MKFVEINLLGVYVARAIILRGGGWENNPVNLRSASRGRGTTFIQSNSLGFRIARTLSP